MDTRHMDPDKARARAEAAFRKEELAQQGAQAWSEYEARIHAIREKTERLRALRLARQDAGQSRRRGQ